MEININRRLYSLGEIYRIIYQGVRTAKYLSRAKKNKELTPELMEQVMLAVTEVNGCVVCSYAHAKTALEAGLSHEEIQNLLSGVFNDVSAEKLPAILFAQHYADSRGKPSEQSWNRIVEVYGLSKAQGILGATRIIMMGNAYGIPWSSFFNRFKCKPDQRSSLFYEVCVMTIGSLMILVAIIHSILSILFKVPVIHF